MAPAPLRYFGVKLAEIELAGLRSDAALGRFVPVAEPLPVGTTVDLDGVPHRVTRVEEGLTPGVWVWTDGAVHQPIPEAVTAPEVIASPERTTDRDIPTVPEMPADVPQPVDAQPTVPTLAQAEEAAPLPVAQEKTDEGAKKRRRRSKTTFGH